jgi:uncharacterized protein (DUF58 family)
MAQEDYSLYRQSRIKFFSRMKLNNIFPGEWESIFTGEGIEFAATKPFEAGDDLRDLDLQTLVQSGEEEIVQRVVGRQRKIYIWVDLSGSMVRSGEMFFNSKPMIRDIAIGLLVFSAWNSYTPVGLCTFAEEVQRFFPARLGEQHCIELLNWVIDQGDRYSMAQADFYSALSFLLERAPRQSLVFFISDFNDSFFVNTFPSLMQSLVRKIDFIPIIIKDPIEQAGHLEKTVNIAVRDSEGNRKAEIYLTPQRWEEMRETSSRHLLNLRHTFFQVGVEPVVLSSSSIDDCCRILSDFFESRKRAK